MSDDVYDQTASWELQWDIGANCKNTRPDVGEFVKKYQPARQSSGPNNARERQVLLYVNGQQIINIQLLE